MAVVVAILDWITGPEVAVGAAYLFPVMLLSLVASRSQIVLLSAACATSVSFGLLFSPRLRAEIPAGLCGICRHGSADF